MDRRDPAASLTTAQLADRTGIPAATLRVWESRYGFPASARTRSGRRRYSERDAELVRSVIRLRGDGLSLSAAIARVEFETPAGPPSIFAGLRQRRPELHPIIVRKPVLLAMTRALEDELCARGDARVLIGSFQTERFFRQSELRWHELARTAEVAVAMAEFSESSAGESPVRVSIRPDAPLAREWTLVHCGSSSAACLSGWEIPAADPVPDAKRRFEVLWSAEPEISRLAITLATELIAPTASRVAARIHRAVAHPGPGTGPAMQVAAEQLHRMLSYVTTAVD